MLQQIPVYFGYLASLCLVIALLVSSDLKFRWYNIAGNVFFITYAIILAAFPVLLTNVILFSINAFHLVKLYNKKENFDLLEFTGDEQLVKKFISFYHKDITDHFPEFKQDALQYALNFMVMRDMVIANIFSATITNNGDAEVLINYTVERYRDYKVGTYIFEKERDYLLAKGIQRIVYNGLINKRHRSFLLTIGFKNEVVNKKDCLVKDL